METLKEALVIESNGMRTSCFIVENVPKSFFYTKAKKVMPMEEYSERLVPAFTLDANGKRVPTGEMVDELHPGIKIDGAGSGAFVFPMDTDDSQQRLKALDKYIDDMIKDPSQKPKRVPYAQMPGSRSSAPKPYSQIIRVKLPAPASPPAVPTAEQGGASPTLVAKKKRIRKPMTDEQRAAMIARLEKARASRTWGRVDTPPVQS